jgi:hypothetical protein
MWANKNNLHIYADRKLKGHLKGDATEHGVLAMKLRWLLGARTYHRNAWVAKTLGAQKKRIGKILGELDADAAFKAAVPTWQVQGLETRWNEYMDKHFTDAEARVKNVLDTYLPALEKKYPGKVDPKKKGPNDDVMKAIKALRTAWDKEKKSTWSKPW